MEFQSKKEISQKKFKEIALSITAYGIISSLLVFFVTKAQVGIEEAFILSIDGILVFILSLIIYKTKSKIAVGILLVFLLLATAITIMQMIYTQHFSAGGLIIKAIIIYYTFTLFEHIKNINNKDFDTYSASLKLENDSQWNDLKEQLEDEYRADGFSDKKQDDNRFFKIKKDDVQFIQMSRNKLNCYILVVANKKPTLK
jgi:hypothetical protein